LNYLLRKHLKKPIKAPTNMAATTTFSLTIKSTMAPYIKRINNKKPISSSIGSNTASYQSIFKSRLPYRN